MMHCIETTIDIHRPLQEVYDQWSRLLGFPRFMRHVTRVHRIGPRSLRWFVRIAGRTEIFETRVTEQVPGRRVAWESVRGFAHSGEVTFRRWRDGCVRLTVRLCYPPKGILLRLAGRLGLMGRAIEEDLAAFKRVLETRRSGRCAVGPPGAPPRLLGSLNRAVAVGYQRCSTSQRRVPSASS